MKHFISSSNSSVQEKSVYLSNHLILQQLWQKKLQLTKKLVFLFKYFSEQQFLCGGQRLYVISNFLFVKIEHCRFNMELQCIHWGNKLIPSLIETLYSNDYIKIISLANWWLIRFARISSKKQSILNGLIFRLVDGRLLLI